jgi:hypothetical protein
MHRSVACRIGTDVLHLHRLVAILERDQITGFKLRHSASPRRAAMFGPLGLSERSLPSQWRGEIAWKFRPDFPRRTGPELI